MLDRPPEFVGQQFGNYRLVRLLRQGGFAQVYLGEHVFLNTYAAIKVLHTQLTQDEQENFLNEARIIARLSHPNIIGVMDFGMHQAIPFLVMDYAPNGSLRDCHPRGSRVPLTLVVSYVKQVADALQYAHSEKLIHRDVKPENMLIGSRGEILLSDFGISIVAQTTQSQHTQEVIGTAPYMAPEQLQGKPRPASDQYSLAVIAYEWLCGERPFQGGSTELYAQHLFTPPPPLRTKNSMISAEVEQVIMTGLAKDPHQRFGSVQAFAHALTQASRVEQFLTIPAGRDVSTLPTSAPAQAARPETPREQAALARTEPSLAESKTPARWSRRSLMFGIAGWAGLLALGAGDLWYALTPHFPPQGTILNLFTSHTDAVQAVAWKGERIASAGTDKTVKVWDAATGDHLITFTGHTDTVQAVSWSPDGTFVASASADQTVQVWRAATGGQKSEFTYAQQATSSSSNKVYAVAWSPSGNAIASGGDDGVVHIWNPTNGHDVFSPFQGHIDKQFRTTSTIYTITWSHDGKYIASGASDGQVLVWEAQTGKILATYKHDRDIYALTWSLDDTRLASASVDKTVRVWTVSPGGDTTQQNIIHQHSDSVYGVSWSSDGQYIASACVDKTIHVWKPTTDTKTFVYRHHFDEVHAVAWSQDSHRLASGGKDATVQVWEGV